MVGSKTPSGTGFDLRRPNRRLRP